MLSSASERNATLFGLTVKLLSRVFSDRGHEAGADLRLSSGEKCENAAQITLHIYRHSTATVHADRRAALHMKSTGVHLIKYQTTQAHIKAASVSPPRGSPGFIVQQPNCSRELDVFSHLCKVKLKTQMFHLKICAASGVQHH